MYGEYFATIMGTTEMLEAHCVKLTETTDYYFDWYTWNGRHIVKGLPKTWNGLS